LAGAVADNQFRGDLFYRLSAVSVNVPPLRARIDDIALLADYFLARQDKSGAETKVLAKDAVEVMRRYSWPGNVRELENLVRRLALTCPETTISGADIQAALGPISAAPRPNGTIGNENLSDSIAAHLRRYFDLHGDALPPNGLYNRILQEMETPLVEIALDASGGNQAKCAELLGINRNTLRKKISDLDIRVTRRRKLM